MAFGSVWPFQHWICVLDSLRPPAGQINSSPPKNIVKTPPAYHRWCALRSKWAVERNESISPAEAKIWLREYDAIAKVQVPCAWRIQTNRWCILYWLSGKADLYLLHSLTTMVMNWPNHFYHFFSRKQKLGTASGSVGWDPLTVWTLSSRCLQKECIISQGGPVSP